MHILEHQEERLPFGQMLDEHPHREPQVDRLVGRIVESEAEDQAEEPGRLGGLLRREERVDGLGELGPGGPGRIVLVDAGDAPDDPADAAVRRLLLVREAPTPEGSPSPPLDPLGGLARDPRLADAGRADDRHDVRATVLDGSLPDAFEEGELAVPPDERRVRRGSAARRLDGLDDRPPGDRLGLALGIDVGERLQAEGVPGEPMRLLADDEPAGCGRVLQAGGRVHDVAGRERVTGRGVDRDHGHAGADRRPHLQVETCVRRVQLRDPLEDREPRPDGSLGVVGFGERCPEHRHDRVADVLLDGPAVALDPLAHVSEVELVPVADVLGIGAVGAGGRPHDVDEQDRHELAFLLPGRGGELVAAGGTEARVLGCLRAASTAAHGRFYERDALVGPDGRRGWRGPFRAEDRCRPGFAASPIAVGDRASDAISKKSRKISRE